MGKVMRFLKAGNFVSRNDLPTFKERFDVPDQRAVDWINAWDRDAKRIRNNQMDTWELLKFLISNSFVRIDACTRALADLAFNFTIDGEMSDDEIDGGVKWILDNFGNKIKSIDYSSRSSCRICFKNGKEFGFSRLNEYYDFKKSITDLTTRDRDSRCHPRSLFIARCAPAHEKPVCVTGRVWSFSPKSKTLHSWVEIVNEEGKEFCIDNNYNIVMDKELYYHIFHPSVEERLSQDVVDGDWDMIQFLNERTGNGLNYLKLYCSSRNEAVELYHEILEMEQGREMKNSIPVSEI